jgi:hypothetical protein
MLPATTAVAASSINKQASTLVSCLPTAPFRSAATLLNIDCSLIGLAVPPKPFRGSPDGLTLERSILRLIEPFSEKSFDVANSINVT